MTALSLPGPSLIDSRAADEMQPDTSTAVNANTAAKALPRARTFPLHCTCVLPPVLSTVMSSL